MKYRINKGFYARNKVYYPERLITYFFGWFRFWSRFSELHIGLDGMCGYEDVWFSKKSEAKRFLNEVKNGKQ